MLESEGIAKGVRRLIAVTGIEADESARLGAEWTARTDALERLVGKEADAALKAFAKDLAATDVSYHVKAVLTERFAKIQKTFADATKAKGTAEVKDALGRIAAHFAADPAAPCFVGKLAISAASLKTLVVKATKETAGDKALFLLNVDPDAPAKVAYANVVPKATLKTLDGKTWAAPVGALLGGKGGGKPDSFSGVGTEVDKVDEAVAAAEEAFRKIVLGA